MYSVKQLTPVVKGIEIDQAYATKARAWASTLETSHPKNLNVALRRIVKAANGRLEPADILVDAVLAWENMFSGTPETNLRVCGSIAHILEPNDFDKRFELFRELKKIYTMRSNIVHGKSEPSLVQLHSAAESALETALSSMRALYRIPELLSAKDAAERGSMTLLGIASTSKQQKEE
nr:HEPN domain-containing protein [Streptomyces sp. SID4985]